MPRTRGVPAYGLHKPTGQARVRIDGRDVYLGVHGSPESKARYQEVVRKHLAERTRAELERAVRSYTDVTITEIAVRYVAHVESYYVKRGRPTGQVPIIKLAIKTLRERFGGMEAREFGPKALKECRDAFVAQGLCRNEVNRRTGLIRGLYKWAASEELVAPSVWHGLQAVQGLRRGRTAAPDHEPIGPVPDAAVEAVRPHVSRQVAAMIVLQRLAGMRPEEVVTMRGRDLVTGGAIWEYRPDSHKTEHRGKRRVIMLGPRAQAIVRDWLKTDLEAFLFSPREAMAERRAARRRARRTPLWPSHEAATERKRMARPRKEPGERYSVESYRRAIHAACDKAGIPRWSPNRLRHAAATAIRRELGLDAARVVLGHSDADTTTIYAERDMELAREAMARLG